MINNKNIFSRFSFNMARVLLVLCFAVFGAANVLAQTAMVTDNFVYYDIDTEEDTQLDQGANFQCRVEPAATTTPYPSNPQNMSFVTDQIAPLNSKDPWINSALIEFDNIYPDDTTADPPYPNHCLSLCSIVTCSNPVRKVEMSATGPNQSSSTTLASVASGDFPIQSILFDIFKYQAGANPYSPDSTPPIRTIAMYPDGELIKNVCKGVKVYGDECTSKPETCKSCCEKCGSASPCPQDAGDGCGDMSMFADQAACEAGITRLNFCTAWDGSYEIDGEFGKTNGQFGFRTTIKTNYPGDGVSIASDVNIEHMIVYPGDSQIPIQVDVTNVHSVRSSPTLVGKSPAVISQPYRLRYRLSKDAITYINIIDPNEDSTANKIVRHLVQGQPRDGEGFQGGSSIDIQITNEDAWDGRDDDGRLLPYGNYLVSIQAQSKDEWSGSSNYDLSRAVTRQLSLDPLKITDIVSTGLNKQSTSYAMLSYMLTEAATVHFEIYTPGTTFNDLNICSETSAGICSNNNSVIYPSSGTVKLNNTTVHNGLRVASYTEQKAGRVNVNSKWDGMCWDQTEGIGACGTPNGATTTTGYSYGGAMPDGDYVYLIWAEIPYGSTAGTDSSLTGNFPSTTKEINGVTWNGVKTYMIYNGILPVNRGYPEITIDAVSYSTIGSSPTASGLDPFVFSYSLSRDSYIDMGIYTTAASGTATSGVCNGDCAPYLVKKIAENEIKEALTKNVYYWDGLNDEGRYVTAGTYMLRITAKDSLFPAKMTTRTIEFPVDMFRVVDVSTTPLLESSTGALKGLAGISYSLSKSMDATVDIYDKNVLIPTGGTCPWPPMPVGPACSNLECCIHDINNPTATVTPIKTFKGTRQGEGYMITDFWDGYKTNNNQNEMAEDGLYPYIITAKANVGATEYYESTPDGEYTYPVKGNPKDSIYATDRATGYITVSRGPVYFSDIKINATKPTQYYSSATVELAPYEILFSVNRVSSVTIEVISTAEGVCLGSTTPIGTICRTLTETNFTNGQLDTYMVYDAGVKNTLYWDGKDSKGKYVRTANYQIRFTGKPYLNNGQTDLGLNETIENRTLGVNNFQVFDRYIWDVSKQNTEQGKFAFQVSVPMKTAIQIYKPGTVVKEYSSGTLTNPIDGTIVYSTNTQDVLVKSIIGVSPNLVGLENIWDGTDYAGQKVPDGIYPFRYVTVLDNYQMDSVTGDPILGTTIDTDEISEVVMDWDKFINMGVINVANGDSWYADLDWKSNQVTMFYPNPMQNNEGFFEITKVPAPGTVNIKIYNIAGDLVRDSGYQCVNAVGTTASLEEINGTGGLSPDWNRGTGSDSQLLGSNAKGRNFALRCQWDRNNNAGKKVARGLYYAIMTLDPTRGNAKKSQKVIKILIP